MFSNEEEWELLQSHCHHLSGLKYWFDGLVAKHHKCKHEDNAGKPCLRKDKCPLMKSKHLSTEEWKWILKISQ